MNIDTSPGRFAASSGISSILALPNCKAAYFNVNNVPYHDQYVSETVMERSSGHDIVPSRLSRRQLLVSLLDVVVTG